MSGPAQPEHPEEYYLRSFIHQLKLYFRGMGSKRLSGRQIEEEIIRLEIEYERALAATRRR